MKTLSIYETGCVRKNNEDYYLVLPEAGLYAVADGMGGHNAGEIASKLAIEELREKAEQLNSINTKDSLCWMTETVQDANSKIFELSSRSTETEGMGTTLTALLIRESKAVIGHIGDSRIYLWRDCTLSLLSEDHSMVNELVRLGQLSKEKARYHPHKNILSRALGVEKDIAIDCFQIEVHKGDVFILCTDGFSNVIDDEELVAELLASENWEQRLKRLKKSVLDRGAPDNFTVVCCILEQ